jgi:hypothetical protein
MSNEKHYPLHPNATHLPVMTCEIPLEEYESLKRPPQNWCYTDYEITAF